MDTFCLIVDFWSESYTGKLESSSSKMFLFVVFTKVHHTVDYQSEVFLIGCYPYELENKRAPTVRLFIGGILGDFGLKLDSEKFVMSDNEPTMKCVFNSNCKRVGCSDLYLSKQLQQTFTSKAIDGEKMNCELAQNMFEDAKNIVTNVRRMHKQQTLSKKLISYSDTRFSGAYDMLVMFLNFYFYSFQFLIL